MTDNVSPFRNLAGTPLRVRNLKKRSSCRGNQRLLDPSPGPKFQLPTRLRSKRWAIIKSNPRSLEAAWESSIEQSLRDLTDHGCGHLQSRCHPL